MACRIIALGSGKRGGNTSLLLDQAIRGAEDGGCGVERISYAHLDLEAAMEAVYGTDPSADPLSNELRDIFRRFQEADGIIVAAPVYTMGVPGRLKSLMDLFLAIFYAQSAERARIAPARRRRIRRGLFLSLAGSVNCPTVFDGSVTTVTAFFGILGFHYSDDLLIDDMDTISDLRTRPDLLESAYDKGLALAKGLKKKKR